MSSGGGASTIRVLLADDSPQLVAAWRKLLERVPDMVLAGVVERVADLVPAISTHQPDVVVMDLSMDEGDPLAILSELRAGRATPRVIVYTGWDTPEIVGQVRASGLDGFVGKHEEPQRLLDAIRVVAGGGNDFPAMC